MRKYIKYDYDHLKRSMRSYRFMKILPFEMNSKADQYYLAWKQVTKRKGIWM